MNNPAYDCVRTNPTEDETWLFAVVVELAKEGKLERQEATMILVDMCDGG